MSKFFESGDNSASGSEPEADQLPEVIEKPKKTVVKINFSSDEDAPKDKKKRTLTEKEKKF